VSTRVRTVDVQLPATIVGGSKTVNVEIQRLASHGFVARTPDTTLTVGQTYEVEFKLPGVNLRISDRIKVVKTYDHVGGDRYSECHFLSPSADGVKAINAYLKSR